MNIRTAARYALLAVLVMVLGALVGWYVFVTRQTRATTQADAARGYTTDASVTVKQFDGGGQGGPIGAGGTGLGGGGTDTSAAAEEGSGGGGFFSRIYNSVLGISDRLTGNRGGGGLGFGLAGFGANNGASSTPPVFPKMPQLWQVSKTPVAGMRFILANGTTTLRYVERGNGYVVDANPLTGTTVRRTNTLIPKVYEATALQSGRVFLRTIAADGGIETLTGIVATSSATSSQALKTTSLGEGLRRISINETNENIVYVAAGQSRGVIMRETASGTRQEQLLDSAISNWRLHTLPDGRIFIAEAAVDGVMGHAYELKNGALAEAVPTYPGLTILPHATSSGMLYSSSIPGNVVLFGRTASTTPVRFPVATISEKCAWASPYTVLCGVPQGLVTGPFLNDWYRGALHTSDAIYVLDTRAGTASLLYAPDSASLDIIDPTVDPSGNYLAFINGSDLLLYVLRIAK